MLLLLPPQRLPVSGNAFCHTLGSSTQAMRVACTLAPLGVPRPLRRLPRHLPRYPLRGCDTPLRRSLSLKILVKSGVPEPQPLKTYGICLDSIDRFSPLTLKKWYVSSLCRACEKPLICPPTFSKLSTQFVHPVVHPVPKIAPFSPFQAQ